MAGRIGWDWRLLTAQIFRESKFSPSIVSWAGAVGLMQVLPGTANELGIKDLKNPEENILAGITHLQWLMDMWEEEVSDENLRLKHVLASYNVGHGHVFDAIRLAEKFGEDVNDWDVISKYLILKSEPEYFKDEVVRFGYCRGTEPVEYVKFILDTYENYKILHEQPQTDTLVTLN